MACCVPPPTMLQTPVLPPHPLCLHATDATAAVVLLENKSIASRDEHENQTLFLDSPVKGKRSRDESKPLSRKTVGVDLCKSPTSVRSHGRRVRFAKDVDNKTKDSVYCTYHYDDSTTIEVASAETSIRWYGPMEFRLFKRDAKRDVMALMKASENEAAMDIDPETAAAVGYLDLFTRLMESCTTADGLRMIRSNDAALACATPHRGLEPLLFQTRRQGKRNVEAVLEKQNEMLIYLFNGDCTMDDVAKAMAATSRQGSQTARRLARVLGSGDAATSVNTATAAASTKTTTASTRKGRAKTPSRRVITGRINA